MIIEMMGVPESEARVNADVWNAANPKPTLILGHGAYLYKCVAPFGPDDVPFGFAHQLDLRGTVGVRVLEWMQGRDDEPLTGLSCACPYVAPPVRPRRARLTRSGGYKHHQIGD